MLTPLKIAVSVLFYIDAFIWLIGVVPTLYYAHMRGALPTMGGIKPMASPGLGHSSPSTVVRKIR